MPTSHQIIIIGAGAAGLAVAASLHKRGAARDIAIIDAADAHYYQPGWTMVGRGIFTPEQTKRPMSAVMPRHFTHIKARAVSYAPAQNTVTLDDGTTLGYEFLIVATGLKLNWAGIEGLEETLGKNGVTSNYRYDLAPYTWRLVQEMHQGEALFTQPPMPIKCAGAPQKAMYLSCDHWLKSGRLSQIKTGFYNAGPALFGVADYVPPLMEYVHKYSIDLNFTHRLTKVDGTAKTATFSVTRPDQEPTLIERRFDMIHVVPPQCAPDEIKASPLANADGWVDVDQHTLQHKTFPNVFSLGDVASTPNAKTAAAARKQAPIVARNLLAVMGGAAPKPLYDGYGSCPLTVEAGKIILAEFGYGGKLLPSFPWDSTQPRRSAWLLKKDVLPWVYWNAMLKGREWMTKTSME